MCDIERKCENCIYFKNKNPLIYSFGFGFSHCLGRVGSCIEYVQNTTYNRYVFLVKRIRKKSIWERFIDWYIREDTLYYDLLQNRLKKIYGDQQTEAKS